jgi:murein DD-endopeptidase MepM/ murein hydrolase activator NlpD
MDWILSFMLLLGSLESASDIHVQKEAERLAFLQDEIIMYADEASAEAALDSTWIVYPEEVYQGDAFMIRSHEETKVEWNGKSYPLLPFVSGYYAMLPVPTNMKPGAYPIGEITVTVLTKSFDTQYLEVTEQQIAMRRNTRRIQADQLKVKEARSQSDSRFLFKDPFIQPVEGRLSTPYGFTRYINGVISGSHKAIDLAAKEGTPIQATNSGKVVLAEELYLTGNSIYIDHGMGLFSQYAHLSELMVTPGQEVQAGEIIGLVGTTGFSTGPHLHFTFWLHGVPANPNRFFGSSPFHWNK